MPVIAGLQLASGAPEILAGVVETHVDVVGTCSHGVADMVDPMPNMQNAAMHRTGLRRNAHRHETSHRDSCRNNGQFNSCHFCMLLRAN